MDTVTRFSVKFNALILKVSDLVSAHELGATQKIFDHLKIKKTETIEGVFDFWRYFSVCNKISKELVMIPI